MKDCVLKKVITAILFTVCVLEVLLCSWSLIIDVYALSILNVVAAAELVAIFLLANEERKDRGEKSYAGRTFGMLEIVAVIQLVIMGIDVFHVGEGSQLVLAFYLLAALVSTALLIWHQRKLTA